MHQGHPTPPSQRAVHGGSFTCRRCCRHCIFTKPNQPAHVSGFLAEPAAMKTDPGPVEMAGSCRTYRSLPTLYKGSLLSSCHQRRAGSQVAEW